jgi:hypothetical protein
MSDVAVFFREEGWKKLKVEEKIVACIKKNFHR